MTTRDERREVDIGAVIGRDGARFAGKKKYILIAAAVLVVLAVWVYFSVSGGKKNSYSYKTEAVRRGDITVTVTATGSLKPLNMVDVGTEVSGTVESVDVDFNYKIKKGQVLARLDTEKLEAQLLQSRAALGSARARVAEAEAQVAEAGAERRRLEKVRELSDGKLPSEHDMDASAAALKRAEAAEAEARAQVAEAEARLKIDETNLTKAVIRSPIDGIVLDRKVEPGQTVAASLQTPVLFTLAEDLRRMELHVDVDEADVGSVEDGQHAAFTVDAHPNRRFDAKVTEVRYAPQTVDGVVTYRALLSVSNDDLMLRPGMTATVTITVQGVKDVLSVPVAALRFSPETAMKQDSGGDRGLLDNLIAPRFRRRPEKTRNNGLDSGNIWVLKDGAPAPVKVQPGATDGVFAEISGPDVKEGMPVITDAVRAK